MSDSWSGAGVNEEFGRALGGLGRFAEDWQLFVVSGWGYDNYRGKIYLYGVEDTSSGEICVDSDGDGYGDPGHPENTCPDDNCPAVYNPDQEDADGDAVGDSCDTCTDTDGDGYGNPGYPANTCPDDNCPNVPNPDQLDSDEDGVGDACEFVCGDADGNGIINISDVVRLIGYIFGGDLPPDPLLAGDADCNQVVNVSDAVYLIAYIFGSGPEPCANCP
jgi:hypothetical protein